MRVIAHVWVGVAWVGRWFAACALAGCLRDTTHGCETPGSCGADAAALVDAAASDGAQTDAPPTTIDVGRGIDGPLLVTGASANDARVNSCARLSVAAIAGESTLRFDPSTMVSANTGTGLASFAADRRVIVWATAAVSPATITIGDQAPYTLPPASGDTRSRPSRP
jgi:hypothetical protein